MVIVRGSWIGWHRGGVAVPGDIGDDEGGVKALLDWYDAHRDESGIIYTNRRKDAETLAEQLTQLGRPALPPRIWNT